MKALLAGGRGRARAGWVCRNTQFELWAGDDKLYFKPAGCANRDRWELCGERAGDVPVANQLSKRGSFSRPSNDQGFPSGTGQFAQRKFYESFGGVLPPIPQQVYFDMHTRSEPQKEDD